MPPFDRDLPKVDVLVLAAIEVQPESLAFHGQVIRCPIPDAELDSTQLRLVAQTSAVVAKAIVDGKRALVTCRMGLNRSALVIAFALHQLTTMSASQMVAHIRSRRGANALSNEFFVSYIERVVGDGRPKAKRRPAQH